MKAEKSIKKLYFIAGRKPTSAEMAEAKSLDIFAFRRADLAETGFLEQAEVVAGKVPQRYRDVKGVKIIEAPKADPAKK